jgi:hypothetical protein
MTLATNHMPPRGAGWDRETTTDNFAERRECELRWHEKSRRYVRSLTQDASFSGQAKILGATWLISIGAASLTDAAGGQAMYPEPASTASAEPLGATEVETNGGTQRGVVPTRIERRALLYSIPVKVRTAELPRWKPKVTGDYGRASRDDE